eukprot:141880-Chlamydomonas_euryale.AAC.1
MQIPQHLQLLPMPFPSPLPPPPSPALPRFGPRTCLQVVLVVALQPVLLGKGLQLPEHKAEVLPVGS